MSSLGRKQGKNGLMVVKLDLEKAYDRPEWDFIRKTLQFFKFPSSLIELILNCVSSTKINVLFNGGRLETFSPSRGIRQGDPISPYIFILCLEYLSIMIEKEVREGNWKGVMPIRGSMTFSHLFFADDIIL